MKHIGRILLPLLLLNGCGPPKPKLIAKVIPVEVTTPHVGEMLQAVEVSGVLRSKDVVTISAEVAEKIVRIYVDEGSRVHAGQTLVQLKTQEIADQIAQTKAAVRAAEARYAQIVAQKGIIDTQARMGLVQASANLKAATARLRQVEKAAKITGVDTSTTVLRAQKELEAAQAMLAQLQSTQRITDTATDSQIAQAEANLNASRERLKQLREGARSQERRLAELAVRQTEVALNAARRAKERAKSLFDSGAISKEMYDQSVDAFDVATAQYNQAREQLGLVQEGPRTEEIRMAEEQVKQAEAAVTIAKANAEQKNISHQSVESAKARVAQAEAALELARASEARSAMSQDDIDTLKAQRNQAEAGLRTAHSQIAQVSISAEEVKAAQAAVAQARAGLSLAQQQLKNTRITSPVSGVVSRRFADVGEMVAPGTPILEVTSMDTVYFQAYVSEMEVRHVHVGQGVEVTVDAVPNSKFKGKVTEVVPVADANSHNFTVKVSVPIAPHLRPGSFARGRIIIARNPSAMLLPKQSLVQRDGKQFVFVVQRGIAKSRLVELDGISRDEVAILSGVSTEDQVVIRGASTLKDGERVRIVDTTSETDKSTHPHSTGGGNR